MKTNSKFGIGAMAVIMAAATALSAGTTMTAYAKVQVKDFLMMAIEAVEAGNNIKALEQTDQASDQLNSVQKGGLDVNDAED